jgi:hypothetical protein
MEAIGKYFIENINYSIDWMNEPDENDAEEVEEDVISELKNIDIYFDGEYWFVAYNDKLCVHLNKVYDAIYFIVEQLYVDEYDNDFATLDNLSFDLSHSMEECVISFDVEGKSALIKG